MHDYNGMTTKGYSPGAYSRTKTLIDERYNHGSEQDRDSRFKRPYSWARVWRSALENTGTGILCLIMVVISGFLVSIACPYSPRTVSPVVRACFLRSRLFEVPGSWMAVYSSCVHPTRFRHGSSEVSSLKSKASPLSNDALLVCTLGAKKRDIHHLS
jgi:hypothetical protein